MRLLILSLPRTGSTSFSKKLANDYNLSLVFEPFAPSAKLFNKTKNFEIDYTKDNIVVKTLINDECDIDWFIDFSNKFDDIFLLSRYDLAQCIDSWAYLTYKRKEIGFDFESEYFWERTPNYIECESQIIRWNYKLEKISKILNKSIIYYEDIFDVTKNRLRKGDKQFNTKIV